MIIAIWNVRDSRDSFVAFQVMRGKLAVRAADLFCITAHTISQRLRTLRKIPPELIPLGMLSSYTYMRIDC